MSKKNKPKTTLKNFRDLGGLKTANGRQIKAGKIFRSSLLRPNIPEEIEFLESLKMDAVVDLRTTQEIKEKGGDILPAGVEYIHADVYGDTKFKVLAPTRKSKFDLIFQKENKLLEIREGMADSYEYLVTSQPYSAIFKLMSEGKTFDFHCTAGKDRTGVASMMIELALGRTREDILHEYLLSNELRRESNEKLFKKLHDLPIKFRDDFYETVRVCTLVSEKHFNRGFDFIMLRGGNVPYLDKFHGISADVIEGWKKSYLEEAKTD
jgi:protein-tyrosine phosphatase